MGIVLSSVVNVYFLELWSRHFLPVTYAGMDSHEHRYIFTLLLAL